MQNVMIRKLFRREDKKCVRTHINTVAAAAAAGADAVGVFGSILCIVHMPTAHTYTLSLHHLAPTEQQRQHLGCRCRTLFVSYRTHSIFTIPYITSFSLESAFVRATRHDGYIVRKSDKTIHCNNSVFVQHVYLNACSCLHVTHGAHTYSLLVFDRN